MARKPNSSEPEGNAPEPIKAKEDPKSAVRPQGMSLRDYYLSLGFKERPPSGKGFVIGMGGKANRSR